MTFYPVDAIFPQLQEAVLRNRSVVLHAPPGAGKTTRVPLGLLDVLPSESRVVMLEPRRIAAVSAARWMAQSICEQVGETVGYTIRFDSKVSSRTRIEVVTEGVLTRRIQSDPAIGGVSLVIFDEFHERSIHADLALALCLDIRKGLREDLKILVMSATLDCGPIASLLENAPIIACSGKAYDVEERYVEQKPGHFAARMSSAISNALHETDGDILAFFPGSGEIRACEKELHERKDIMEDPVSLHPLYGDLPFEEQERAILPSKDRRKIVLATNIAETSLTIEGVRVVIDGGLTRRLRYDPSTGMNRLVTVPVSKASAEQRKGRAGRLGPGACYRLFGRYELTGMPAFTPPEILESDLSGLVLELAAWGIKNSTSLSWLDLPPAAAWNAGLQLLKELGAADGEGSITPIGREMSRLPLHPRLARLMIRARELNCLRLGADLAAVLSERDLFRKKSAEQFGMDPDIGERVAALRRWEKDKETVAYADTAALRAVARTSKQLIRLMTGSPTETNRFVDPERISRLLLAAYPDRICKRREESTERFVIVQGRGVRIFSGSHLTNSLYIIAPVVDLGEKSEGIVYIAASVTEKLIRSECAGQIETVRRVEWDQREGRIASAVEERIGALLLSKKSINPSEAEVFPILCDVIRNQSGILRFSDTSRQFQARAALVARAFPEEAWPDLSEKQLMSRPEVWFATRLEGIRTSKALQEPDVLPALKAILTWEQQRLLDERAPIQITVPSGSRVRIDYLSGEQPVLAVKLQEMFGLSDTPMIAEGRVKILLHLLSPAQRPVQITQDLKGFWNNGYQLVKRDLKGRYPKHPWPEDPWNAVPTKRIKSSNRQNP